MINNKLNSLLAQPKFQTLSTRVFKSHELSVENSPLSLKDITQHSETHTEVMGELMREFHRKETQTMSKFLTDYLEDSTEQTRNGWRDGYDIVQWSSKMKQDYSFRDAFTTTQTHPSVITKDAAHTKLQQLVNGMDPVGMRTELIIDRGLNPSVYHPYVTDGIAEAAPLAFDGTYLQTREYRSILVRSADYFSQFLENDDFLFLLEFADLNERFLMATLLPFLAVPLRCRQWGFLFCISTVAGNFGTFIKAIAKKVVNVTHMTIKSTLGSVYSNLSPVIRPKIVGLFSLTSMLLYKYGVSQTVVALERQLYVGFSGMAGDITNALRLEGSKLIFEVTKTLSTFSNAALAGFIEPKEQVAKQLLEWFKRR